MFRKAERKQAKLRLALCGPAGSGKTYSALLLAQGWVGPWWQGVAHLERTTRLVIA